MFKQKYILITLLSFISIGIISSFVFQKINTYYVSHSTFKYPKDYDIDTQALAQLVNITMRDGIN